MKIKDRLGKLLDYDGEIISEKKYLGRVFVLLHEGDKNFSYKYAVHDSLTGVYCMGCNSKSGWLNELKALFKNREDAAINIIVKHDEINSNSFQEGVDAAKKIAERPDARSYFSGYIYYIEENTDIFG